nr:polysaccharide biosynthesis/export family protein [Ralstonia solanacearum]
MAAALGGCSTYPDWLPSAGPSRAQIEQAPAAPASNSVQIVAITDGVTRRLLASRQQVMLSSAFGEPSRPGYVIGAGDMVEVSVWEAPPAVLFGGALPDSRTTTSTLRATTLPEQMVSADGTIDVPFASRIRAAGRTPQQVSTEIVQHLRRKANDPQVLVRVTNNNTANVTVVGEVNRSLRMPLTAKGERLLDALAAAGGVRQPVNKMTLQVARAGRVQAMPLEAIIRDPQQNIVLQPGDVVTALYQPLSFTVLGAAGKNEEINFEAQGISLAQALARTGGLQDIRADARGVFLFRFESPEVLGLHDKVPATPEGKVPVVYQADLKDPATFFVAQNFPVQNGDVLYVSNAPAAELQKFLNILTSSIYSVSNAVALPR